MVKRISDFLAMYFTTLLFPALVVAEQTYDDSWLDDVIFGEEEKVVSPWNSELYLSGGYGYRENALLSEVNVTDSPFVFTGLEAMAIRSGLESNDEWLILLLAENRSFEDLDEFENETLVFGQAHYTRKTDTLGRLGAGVEYLFSKQAFDSSIDEIETSSVGVEGSQVAFAGDWKFTDRNKLKFSIGQMSFDDESNDYDLRELSYAETFSLGEFRKLDFYARAVEREYVSRFARDNEGYSIDGDLLELSELKSRLSLGQKWSFAAGDTHLKAYAEYAVQSSSSSEYYNRKNTKLGMRLRWRSESWSFSADAAYLRSEYGSRLGSDDELRSDRDFKWSIELERVLKDDWSVYLQMSDGEKETNESLSSYDTNTFTLGIRVPPIRLK